MKIIYLFTLLIPSLTWADLDTKMDAVNRDAHTDLRRLADRIDHIFGTTRSDDNKSNSTLRLSAQESIEDNHADNPSFSVGFNLKLATLQRWNDKFNQWINRNLRKLESDFEPDKSKPSGGKSSAPTTSAPPAPEEKDPWRFSIEKKFVVARDPSGYARARMSKDFEGPYFLHAFSWQAGWDSHSLWSSQMSFVSSHHLGGNWLLSFGNSANYAISAKSFTTGHGPALSHMITEYQVLSLGLSMSTSVVDKNWSAQGYTLAASYRLEAWNEMLYFSFNPYLSFVRGDRFHGNPGLTTSLELVF